jgi:hypothetical protein
MEWSIWYANGTTFDSDDGTPADAPGSDVVVITQKLPERKAVTVAGQSFSTVEGFDWYLFRDGMWFASNLMGLCQYVAEPGRKIIKMGRWVHPQVYDDCMKEAAVWLREH